MGTATCSIHCHAVCQLGTLNCDAESQAVREAGGEGFPPVSRTRSPQHEFLSSCSFTSHQPAQSHRMHTNCTPRTNHTGSETAPGGKTSHQNSNEKDGFLLSESQCVQSHRGWSSLPQCRRRWVSFLIYPSLVSFPCDVVSFSLLRQVIPQCV